MPCFRRTGVEWAPWTERKQSTAPGEGREESWKMKQWGTALATSPFRGPVRETIIWESDGQGGARLERCTWQKKCAARRTTKGPRQPQETERTKDGLCLSLAFECLEPEDGREGEGERGGEERDGRSPGRSLARGARVRGEARQVCAGVRASSVPPPSTRASLRDYYSDRYYCHLSVLS